MTRVAVALSCSAEQRTELINLARSRRAEARLVERAKIVLACLDGKRNAEVSRALGMRPNTVSLWRTRFAAQGIAGLRDQSRPGKKPKYGAEMLLPHSAAIGIAAAARVGRVGWRYPGGRARRFGRRGLAGVAQRRHSVAPASLVVRQHRPAVCRKSGRYYRLVPRPPGQRAGA